MAVFHRDFPPRTIRLYVFNLVTIANFRAVFLRCRKELLSQPTIVDVGAFIRPGNSHFFGIKVAPLRHEWKELGKFIRVVRELHVRKQGVAIQCLIAFAQIGDLRITLTEGHVWHRVDEALWVRQHSLINLVRPELPRDLEFFIHRNGFLRLNFPLHFRGVVQLAQCRMTSTRVVPRGGGFFRWPIQTLEDDLRPPRFQFPKHGPQRGTHNSGTNENNISLVGALHCGVRRI